MQIRRNTVLFYVSAYLILYDKSYNILVVLCMEFIWKNYIDRLQFKFLKRPSWQEGVALDIV